MLGVRSWALGRLPRNFVPGGIYHVYSRGSNKQAIFADDLDRFDFLNCVERVVRRFELLCLGYCLMPNHYHLIVQSLTGRISAPMHALNGHYAFRFNRRHSRDAHLFKNRFGAVHQQSDGQLLWTLCYLARNPVDAGLCHAAEEWRWSSYRAMAGMVKAPEFLAVEKTLSFFGDESNKACARYRELVELSLQRNGV